MDIPLDKDEIKRTREECVAYDRGSVDSLTTFAESLMESCEPGTVFSVEDVLLMVASSLVTVTEINTVGQYDTAHGKDEPTMSESEPDWIATEVATEADYATRNAYLYSILLTHAHPTVRVLAKDTCDKLVTNARNLNATEADIELMLADVLSDGLNHGNWPWTAVGGGR